MESTPVTLLEQLRQPANDSAWQRFAKLYTPMLFRWARQQGLEANDAADLLQEVFVVLVRKLPEFQYDPSKKFRGWLRTILLHKWKNLCRERRYLKLDPRGLDAQAEQEEPAREFFDENEYRKLLLASALKTVQGDFQPHTWQAFWEHAIRGLPAARVAAQLGTTVGAVYAARLRVLQRLRQELSGFYE